MDEMEYLDAEGFEDTNLIFPVFRRQRNRERAGALCLELLPEWLELLVQLESSG